MVKHFNATFIGVGFLLMLVGFLIILTQMSVFHAYPNEMSIGITLDFIITIPVLYFFLIRQKKAIPKFSVISVFVVCLIIAGIVLPTENQDLLTKVKYVAVPLIELSVLAMVIYKTRSIIRTYQKQEKKEYDFFNTISLVCKEVMPERVGQILATEIAVFYYLFSTKKKSKTEFEYTYFRKSGIKTIVSVMLELMLVETLVVHLVLEKWNSTVAWVLTILGLYTFFQIIALLRSMNHRLIKIDTENKLLHLRYGFFSQTTIPFSAISKIEQNRKSLPEDKSIIQFSPLGFLDTHNIIITVSSKLVLHRLYGFKNDYQAIAIFIDEKEKFIEDLNMALSTEK